MSEFELPTPKEIATAADNCDWMPGPPKWANEAARQRYEELNARVVEIGMDYQRRLKAEVAPYLDEIAEIYSRFASPTVYPVPKPLRAINEEEKA